VVTKYPYGWSYVSPSFHIIPFMKGRLLGRLPTRGDVVIVTPTGETSDYIKRVIGLPGDRIAVVRGAVVLNGVPVKRVPHGRAMIPIDAEHPLRPAPGHAVPDGHHDGQAGLRAAALSRNAAERCELRHHRPRRLPAGGRLSEVTIPPATSS
jgi:hypothetical protein